MYKLFLLFFLLFSFSIFSNDFIELYTTADFLALREKSSSKSSKLNLLPYGTKIMARRTKVKERVEGVLDSWYELKDNEGFVFGHYIVGEPVLRKEKRMQIYRIHLKCKCSGVCTYEKTRLELYNNKAKALVEISNDAGEKKMLAKKGVYKYSKNHLTIQFKKLKPQKHPPYNIKEVISLYYSPDLKAFLEEDVYKMAQLPKTQYDKQKCFLITEAEQKNKKTFEKYSLDKEKKQPIECEWERKGYYCIK